MVIRRMANEIPNWLAGKIAKIREAVAETGEVAAEGGKQATRAFVATRGTVKSGKQGRIDTGKMLDRVDGKSERITEDETRAEFGWYDGKDGPEWFQEFGFNHRNGSVVEGMYAISDARDMAEPAIMETLRKKLGNI